MPRKYRPQKYDYFFFSAAESVYGMLRPVEEQLQKGGYRGNILSDYCKALSDELEREPNSTLFFNELMDNSHAADERDMLLDSKFLAVETLTKSSAKRRNRRLTRTANFSWCLSRRSLTRMLTLRPSTSSMRHRW